MESQSLQSVNKYIIFVIDKVSYALPLESVEKVINAVEVVPLPKAPDIVLGVINVHGRITPVVNLRKRFRLPEREINLSDQLIIARAAKRSVALVADAVGDVVECLDEKMIPARDVLPEMEYVEGVINMADGLVLVHNLCKFLSFKEEGMLNDAIRDL